jgi:hypothetical protein
MNRVETLDRAALPERVRSAAGDLLLDDPVPQMRGEL